VDAGGSSIKNLRERRPFTTQDFKITKTRTHSTNAVMRAYGNSILFPWSTITKDLSVIGNLSDCSLLYFDVEDDSVIDIINSFTFEDLIFSRFTGETASINPTACLINRHDILHCYEEHLKKNE